MTKPVLVVALATALALHALPSSALSLIQAYEAALQNDPAYRMAVHENEAGQQNRLIGRSYLLPAVSASYSTNKNHADITQPNILGQQTTSHPAYTSMGGGINLRQPLFNMDGLARYNQGVAQASYSESLFAARAQDLVIRLVSAYADARYAEDQLALATVQRDAFAEQMKLNERMFKLGEGTRTDMLETQAKYDLAEAQLLEARDNVTNTRNSLAAIAGVDVDQLDSLTDDFNIKPMSPASFDEWKAMALERNAEIAAQRYSVEAAEQEIKKGRAGHAPRVDLVAGYNKALSETVTTRNQDSVVRSYGVQVSIPVYSGGLTSAVTAQAVANHERAKSELDSKTNQVLVELRKQYNLALSSASRIEALVKTVNSARLALQATQQSVKGGVRINLDVLNAQQQFYAAQRDLAQARYNYLVSYLRLRFAAGTLGADDLRTVAAYFVSGSTTSMLSESVQPMRVLTKPVQPATAPAVNPQPAVKTTQSANADASDEVLKHVQTWAKAWEAKDMKGYFASYAADFQPAKKQSRTAWAKERETRIAGKGHIVVKVEAPKVFVNGDQATVKFRQVYESDSVKDVTVKTLTMAREGGEWKIRQEVAGS